jgi:hypothetical protein
MAGPQARLRNPRDILPVDQDPTAPHVIEALDQREEAGPIGASAKMHIVEAHVRALPDLAQYDSGMVCRPGFRHQGPYRDEGDHCYSRQS